MAAPFVEQPQAEQPPVSAPPPQQQFATAPQVVGNPQDEIRRQEAIDPTEVETPTDEEQAMYDDFVSRAIALIADNRKGGEMSPSESVLNLMNNKSFSVPEALAEGAANTIMLLHNAAKRAGVTYTPDVIFHGADEVIAGLYLLGSAQGIFQGSSDHSWATAGGAAAEAQPPMARAGGAANEAQPPMAQAGGAANEAQPPMARAGGAANEAQPAMATPEAAGAVVGGEARQPVPDDGELPSEGDFTEEEYMLLAEAKIIATEKFGRKLLESGQFTEKEKTEAQEFWKSQIAKEVETGQVDDTVFDRVDVDSVRKNIAGA